MEMEKMPMKDRDMESEKGDVDFKREKRVAQYDGQTSSMPLCIFNLMNAILGSGILGLANAAANLGVVLFTIMLVGVSGLAFNSIRLLLEMCNHTGVSSYETLGKIAFGTFGKFLTAINIFIHTMGAMCSFLFIVKYELPEVIRAMGQYGPEDCDKWFLKGDILIIVATLVVIMPLASAKNIGFLGYTSGFAMGCMIFFTGVIVAEHWVIPCPVRDFINLESDDEHSEAALSNATSLLNATGSALATTVASPVANATSAAETEGSCGHEESAIHLELKHALENQTCDVQMVTWNSKSAYAIPTMVFAFQCHASVLPIYTELDNPTIQRMQKVSIISIGNVFCLYFLAALFGYLTFYSATGPELLLMYSSYNSDDIIILVSRIMVLICVTFSTPLLHYPARKAIDQMLFEGQPFSWIRHLGIMVVLLSTINLLVVYVPTIQEVFGFAGATCASMLVIILPSLFYVRIIPGSLKEPKKIVAMSLVVIGFGFIIFSMILIISRWIS